MRVIVTGSRSWTGHWGIDRIYEVLDATLHMGTALGQGFELIHGACPIGADEIANSWAEVMGEDIMLTTWPAQWELYGKAAGPVRNEQMTTAGADLCVAFLRNNSSGTLDCISKARRRKIWTVVIPWDGDAEVIKLDFQAAQPVLQVRNMGELQRLDDRRVA